MGLLHDINGKIPMYFIISFFHVLKETSQLFIRNFSTLANISISISNRIGEMNRTVFQKNYEI
jgi:hypothetical protein